MIGEDNYMFSLRGLITHFDYSIIMFSMGIRYEFYAEKNNKEAIKDIWKEIEKEYKNYKNNNDKKK